MSLTALWVVLLLGVAGFLIYLGMRGQRPKPTPVRPRAYRCVGIEAPDPHTACSAVKSLAGHRFLAGQAPQLPVPGCTAPRCTCKFVHYDDRRAGNRRRDRGQQVRSLKALDWAERRIKRGRRKVDRAGPLNEAQVQAALVEKRRKR